MKKLTLTFIFIFTAFSLYFAQGGTCGSSTSITVNSSCTNTAFSFSGTNSIANPSCVASALYDAWYSFVATEATTNIDLSSMNKDGAVAVYSDCSGTLVDCANATTGATESLSVTTTPGLTYYIRIQRVGSSGGGSITGNICVYSTPTSTSCNYTLYMNDSYGDGWNGGSITFNQNGSNTGTYTLSSGSSGSTAVSISDGASVLLNFTSGSFDYEITWSLVDPFGNVVCSGTGPTAGQICSFTANCSGPDAPCSADNLNPGSSLCGALTYTTSNNNNKTDSGIADPGCGNYGGEDVWFTTTVPSSGGFDVLTQANGLNDMAMAVYTGTDCSSLSLLFCSSNGNGNMPTGTVSGLTPGDNVWIRVWDEGGNSTGTFNIALDDPDPNYCLVGSAYPAGSNDCIQLTDAVNSQNGCAWSGTPFDFSSNFDSEFTVNLGSSDSGADGLCFVIQNSASGPSAACGVSGGGIGAQGITPSLIIEFDTWQNGTTTGNDALWEPWYDHISVETDGVLIGDGVTNSAPFAGPVQASSTSTNIEDGLDHTVRITYDASTNLISIYFDGVFRLSFTLDLATFFGSSSAYWGFTASTGGAVNNQSFCPGNLPGFLADEKISMGINCSEKSPIISWRSNVDIETLVYTIEKSENRTDFSKVADVNSLAQNNFKYSYIDHTALNSKSYYRIKAQTRSGANIYSNIETKTCSKNTGLNAVSDNGKLYVSFEETVSKNTTISLYDVTGKLILANNFTSERGQNIQVLDVSNLSSAVYILTFFNEGTFETQKIIIK